MASSSVFKATASVINDPNDHTNASTGVSTPSDPTRRSKRTRRGSTGSSLPQEPESQREYSNFTSEAPTVAGTPPPKQKGAYEPVHCCDNGTGIRLIDLGSLKQGAEHLCCRLCAENEMESMMEKRMHSFFDFHNKRFNYSKLVKTKRPTMEDSYNEFKKSQISGNNVCNLDPIQLKSETIGFATNLHFECKKSEHNFSVEAQKVSRSFYDGQQQNSHMTYWVNYLIVMCMHRIGCGMYHAQQLAGFLGLPSFKRVPYMFRVVEDKLGPVLCDIALKSKEDALKLEKEATMRHAAVNATEYTIVDGKVGICVASDTHWPRRGGGGKKYVSPSGLTYMIGSLTGMIVASHVCSQDCRICTNFEKKRKAGKLEPDARVHTHRCPRNYPKSKSPKTMETASTVIMVTSVFNSDADVFVEYICIDDDTTMMSHLRRKSDGGNLPDTMPTNFPIRISDLNHRIRSIGHVVFDLARSTMENSRVTTFVAYRYKKALSYFVYGMINDNCTAQTFIANKLAPLEHIFGNHEFCTEQCPGKRAIVSKEDYRSKIPPLDKKMHRDIYLDLHETTKPYFEPERVAQIVQEKMPTEIVIGGTQPCEAVNNADCCMAPKNRHYSSTCSLGDRSSTMVGTHNLGEIRFYTSVSDCIIDVPLNSNQLSYFEFKWGKKVNKRKYQSTKSVKRKRTEQSKSRLKSTIQDQMLQEALADQLGEGDVDAHKSTMVLMTTEEIDEFKKEKKKLLAKATRPCTACNQLGHYGVTSWMCPKNKNNLKNIEISDGNIPDDRKPKKLKEKKSTQKKTKEKTQQKTSDDSLSSLSVKDLRLRLKSHGLKTSGNKPELIQRLTDFASASPSPHATTSTSIMTSATPILPSPFQGAVGAPPAPPLPVQHQQSPPIVVAAATTVPTIVVRTTVGNPLKSSLHQDHQQQQHTIDITAPPLLEQQRVPTRDTNHEEQKGPPERTSEAKEATNTCILDDDIGMIVDYQFCLDEGLVQDPRPRQAPVQTYVGGNSGNSRRSFFRDLEDITDGIAALCDPDEFTDFGASAEDL
jgi:hypothetical protein